MTAIKSGITVGQIVTEYAPVWIDNGRAYWVEFSQEPDWSPDLDYGKNNRKRGSVIAMAKITRVCQSLWLSSTPGTNELHEVPNYTEPTFKILRRWKWTGFRWKEIKEQTR